MARSARGFSFSQQRLVPRFPAMSQWRFEIRAQGTNWLLYECATSVALGSYARRADAIAAGRQLRHLGDLRIIREGAEAETEEQFLLALWHAGVCPYCELTISGRRTGTGKKAAGGFCSLSCYANYYRTDILERVGTLRPN